MGPVRVRVSQEQVDALADDPPVRAQVRAAAEGVAAAARLDAPVRTGGGASSIVSWPPQPGQDTSTVDVSWDQSHFYMVLQHDGFRGQPGRHFLRRALDTYRQL